MVLFGNDFARNGLRSQALRALWNLGLTLEARLVPLPQDINERGLVELGRLFPGRDGNPDQILRCIAEGGIKVLYGAGLLPDLGEVRPETVIVQGQHWAERPDIADIVFPVAGIAESDGSFLGLEGRLRHVESCVPASGESRPGWWIVSQIAKKMGFQGFDYRDSAEILAEIKQRIPGFSETGSVNPAAEAPEFVPPGFSSQTYSPNAEFPFLLMMLSGNDHYQGFDLSRELRSFRRLRDGRWVRIHPQDARKAKVKDGDDVRLESASGSIDRIIRVTDDLPRGVLEATASAQEAAARGFFAEGVVPVRLLRRL